MSVLDPISAVLDDVGAHLQETLGAVWSRHLAPFPVAAKTFGGAVRRAPAILVTWTDFGGQDATALLEGPLKILVVLAVRESDVQKVPVAANAHAVKAAMSLHRRPCSIVLAPGEPAETVGTLMVSRVAPVQADGLASEGVVLIGIDVSIRLALLDGARAAAGLPDFHGLDIDWDLPGLPDAAADVVNVQEAD